MEILIIIAGLLFSVILHEIMHGYVAERLGDPTARYAGRLTLNPIPHIDPFMTILIPAILILSGSPIIFGAAKPVPVNPLNLREGRKDMALVALGGPLTNIGLAIVFALLFHVLGLDVLIRLVILNLALGILNLIPIPPLDGSKFISSFLPLDIARSYDSIAPFGIFILFFLLMFPIGGFSLVDMIRDLVFFGLRLLGIGV